MMHGSKMEFNLFPINAAVVGGALVIFLVFDTFSRCILIRHKVALPTEILPEPNHQLNFALKADELRGDWGTTGEIRVPETFASIIYKGDDYLIGLRVKRPMEFQSGTYPGSYVLVSLGGGTKDSTHEHPFTVPSNAKSPTLDLLIINENKKRVSSQSFTREVRDCFWSASDLAATEAEMRDEKTPLNQEIEEEFDPSLAPVHLGIRGPFQGPIASALRSLCLDTANQPFFVIMLGNSSGIAPMRSIIQSGIDEHGWVPAHFRGAYFAQLNTRADITALEYNWTPDLYYQHVLLPKSYETAWNTTRPYAPITFFSRGICAKLPTSILASEPDQIPIEPPKPTKPTKLPTPIRIPARQANLARGGSTPSGNTLSSMESVGGARDTEVDSSPRGVDLNSGNLRGGDVDPEHKRLENLKNDTALSNGTLPSVASSSNSPGPITMPQNASGRSGAAASSPCSYSVAEEAAYGDKFDLKLLPTELRLTLNNLKVKRLLILYCCSEQGYEDLSFWRRQLTEHIDEGKTNVIEITEAVEIFGAFSVPKWCVSLCKKRDKTKRN